MLRLASRFRRSYRRLGRRRLRLQKVVDRNPDVVPRAGTHIRAGDREIGEVTSSTRSPALGVPIALGYVHRDFTAAGTKVSVDGADAEVSAVPFSA